MKKFIIYLFMVLLGGVLVFVACNQNNPKPGLQGLDACYTIQGGNSSRQLYATDPWYIVIPVENNWVRVTPSSGQGSEDLIDLMFTADFNANTQSRETPVYVYIGGNKYVYIISQDGTNDQVCIF